MQALTYLTPDKGVGQMHRADARGYRVSGASAAASAAYERALATCQSWRSGAELELAAALQEAPGFTMAHVLQAYLFLCSRDPERVRAAAPAHARAAALPANERERMHVGAIGAVLADDYERAMKLLGELLRRYPRDVLALQVAHLFDYLSGDVAGLARRVAAVLPAWSSELPGYAAILAMHAFGLEEGGDYERAEQAAEAALELNPFDARAHHVMAHVFDMTERPAAGIRWMGQHSERWGAGTIVATHCWWHLALFHLAQGEPARALAIYDRRIRAGSSAAIADLIDASALLWRVRLQARDTGARWAELADAWAPHIDDRFCSFNDLHAMLAFVGAGDWARASRLERVLAGGQSQPTRHGATTRQLGLPACRALIAFGRGNDTLALTLLASLPALAHRFGGSHAQRDVLNLTMLAAIERLRRPVRWSLGRDASDQAMRYRSAWRDGTPSAAKCSTHWRWRSTPISAAASSS
jgi:tetratricopeptide (TPR) repeat protein